MKGEGVEKFLLGGLQTAAVKVSTTRDTARLCGDLVDVEGHLLKRLEMLDALGKMFRALNNLREVKMIKEAQKKQGKMNRAELKERASRSKRRRRKNSPAKTRGRSVKTQWFKDL